MSRYYLTTLIFCLLLITSISLMVRFDVPWWWFALLICVYLVINAMGSAILSMQFFVPVKFRGEQSDAIAITFDDGPVAGKTEKVLDILRHRNIKSAFFCIGKRVKENPELACRIHHEGHLLGNHSYFHDTLFDLQSSKSITKELEDTDAIVKETIGKKPVFFRPPYGVTNPMISRALRKKNYKVIGWSVRSFDTVIKDREKLFKRVTQSVKGGDIVLFHDHSESMLDILPDFLDYVKGLGLKIVRVDELLNEKAYGENIA